MPAPVAFAGEARSRSLALDDAPFVEGDPAVALERSQPDIAVLFDPVLPEGAMRGFRGISVAILTQPGRADPSNFDRIVAAAPGIDDSALWRTIPFPVADSQFRDVAPLTGQPRICLDGEPTNTRTSFLARLGPELAELPWLAEQPDCDVVIHLHDESDRETPERIARHLAAGRLLIADRQRPRADLVPGVHYVEARAGWHLGQLVHDLRRWPDNHDVVRMRARRLAERSRASSLYPRLFEDLYRDIATFGSDRPKA